MSPVLGVGSSLDEFSAGWRVAENEDAFSPMGGTDIGSSNARPACTVPERGQVTEYSAEPPAPDRRNVLHDDELRLQDANALGDGEPESTTRPLRNAQCRHRGRRN